jgi:hypothetical protein
MQRKWSSTTAGKYDPDSLRIVFRRASANSKVFSGDFTNATGEITHEFLDLLSEELEIPPDLLHKRFTVDGCPVTSGAFQGMPCSWIVGLQLGHYAIASLVDPDHSFRIKGDDIIALWDDKKITLYCRLTKSVGLLVNDKTIISLTRGTFCEADYVRSGNTLSRLPTFSIRSFIKDELLSEEQLNSFLRRGVDRETLCMLQRRCHKRWITLARAKNVPLYVSRQFGGLGLLPPDPYAAVDVPTAVIVRSAHNGTLPMPREATAGVSTYTKQCASFLDKLRMKCDCAEDYSSVAEKLSAKMLAIAEFRSALEGELSDPFKIGPRKVINSLYAFRRRALFKRSLADPFIISFSEMENIKDRLGVTKESYNGMVIAMAMANRVSPWFSPRM